jgi:hypothetical protein
MIAASVVLAPRDCAIAVEREAFDPGGRPSDKHGVSISCQRCRIADPADGAPRLTSPHATRRLFECNFDGTLVLMPSDRARNDALTGGSLTGISCRKSFGIFTPTLPAPNGSQHVFNFSNLSVHGARWPPRPPWLSFCRRPPHVVGTSGRNPGQ